MQSECVCIWVVLFSSFLWLLRALALAIGGECLICSLARRRDVGLMVFYRSIQMVLVHTFRNMITVVLCAVLKFQWLKICPGIILFLVPLPGNLPFSCLTFDFWTAFQLAYLNCAGEWAACAILNQWAQAIRKVRERRGAAERWRQSCISDVAGQVYISTVKLLLIGLWLSFPDNYCCSISLQPGQ